LCTSWKTRASIVDALRDRSPAEIDKTIGELLAGNLLLEIDGQFLTLATRMYPGMRAAPLALDALASLSRLSWRNYIAAGRALGARWPSAPQRLGRYWLGKLIFVKEKLISIATWWTVRFLLKPADPR
jgi:hypothetical protein